jgi:hypothetical protein
MGDVVGLQKQLVAQLDAVCSTISSQAADLVRLNTICSEQQKVLLAHIYIDRKRVIYSITNDNNVARTSASGATVTPTVFVELNSNCYIRPQLIARLYEPGAVIANEEYDITTTLVVLDLENEELRKENAALRQRLQMLCLGQLKSRTAPSSTQAVVLTQSFGSM